MDLTLFLQRDGNNIGLLVIVDHFTKYAWTKIIKNKKAETVVNFLEGLFRNELKLKVIVPADETTIAVNLRSIMAGKLLVML